MRLLCGGFAAVARWSEMKSLRRLQWCPSIKLISSYIFSQERIKQGKGLYLPNSSENANFCFSTLRILVNQDCGSCYKLADAWCLLWTLASVQITSVMKLTSLAACIQLVMILTAPPSVSSMMIPDESRSGRFPETNSENFRGDAGLSAVQEGSSTTHRRIPTVETVARTATLRPGARPLHENSSERMDESSRVAAVVDPAIQPAIDDAASAPTSLPSLVAADSKAAFSSTSSPVRKCKPLGNDRLMRKFKRNARKMARYAEKYCLNINGCDHPQDDSDPECLCQSQGYWQYDEDRFPPYVYSVKCETATCSQGRRCEKKYDRVQVLRKMAKVCTNEQQREQWQWQEELISVACSCSEGVIFPS